MELRTPRQKYKNNSPVTNFPVPFRGNDEKFKGYFNGFAVVIPNFKDAKEINRNGCFGKAEFSRTLPNELLSSGEIPEILRNRQYVKRNRYPVRNDRKPKKVLVVPDSDSTDNEEYFTDLKPTYGLEKSVYENRLILSLVEAYFLAFEIGCLEISNLKDVWTEFNDIDSNFIVNYVVYLHFRSKNWVVKSGIKFGGDFLLYKQGPAYFHASYVVIIDVVENLKRIDSKQRRSMEYMNLMGLNRLCETAAKELLICQVIWPKNTEINSSEDINKLSINELLFRRFILSQN